MVKISELYVKSAITKSKGGLQAFVKGLPTRYSLNPYMGCTHCCKYCYARFVTKFSKLHNTHSDFCNVIGVKANIDDVLRRELKRNKTDGSVIWIGSVTDPYMGVEGKYELMRKILYVLNSFNQPYSIFTRSPLVSRDVDLLRKDLAEVIFTTTNIRGPLKSIIEPFSPRTDTILETIEELSKKVATRAAILPIIPTVNDNLDELKELIKNLAIRGVRNVYVGFLRLTPFTIGVIKQELPTNLFEKIINHYGEQHSSALIPKEEYRKPILDALYRYSKALGIGFYVEDPLFFYAKKPTEIDKYYYATLHDYYSLVRSGYKPEEAYKILSQRYRVDVSLEEARKALNHVREP